VGLVFTGGTVATLRGVDLIPGIADELEFPEKSEVGFFLRVPIHFLIPQHLMIVPLFLFNPARPKTFKYGPQK